MEPIIDYEDFDPADLEEILEVLENFKEQPKAYNFDFDPGKEGASGSGFVTDSFFVATKRGIFWIVRLKGGNFAFMKVTPDWIKFYANIILLSPEIFVEFNKFHRIVLWVAEQDKVID